MTVPASPELRVHEAKLEMMDAATEFRQWAGQLPDPLAREITLRLADELDGYVLEAFAEE
jgi:hypothetical protein